MFQKRKKKTTTEWTRRRLFHFSHLVFDLCALSTLRLTYRLHSALLTVCTPPYLPSAFRLTYRLHSALLTVCIPPYLPSAFRLTYRLHSALPTVCTPPYLPSALRLTYRLHSALLLLFLLLLRHLRFRYRFLFFLSSSFFIVQELCESRGCRPGLSILTSLLASVDVKIYWTMLRHWSQLVPNMSADIRGH